MLVLTELINEKKIKLLNIDQSWFSEEDIGFSCYCYITFAQISVDVIHDAFSQYCSYDYPGLAAASDFLFIMAYDESGYDHVGPNADFSITSQGMSRPLVKYNLIGCINAIEVVGTPMSHCVHSWTLISTMISFQQLSWQWCLSNTHLYNSIIPKLSPTWVSFQYSSL